MLGVMTTTAESGRELRMATLRLARRLRAEKSSEELSDAHFSVLAWLHVHGAHTLSELAEREHVSAPSMNRTVNGLELAGYLTRSAHPEDRRKLVIELTAAGTATVTETIQLRDAWLTGQLELLTAEERGTLAAAADIMRRLATQ